VRPNLQLFEGCLVGRGGSAARTGDACRLASDHISPQQQGHGNDGNADGEYQRLPTQTLQPLTLTAGTVAVLPFMLQHPITVLQRAVLSRGTGDPRFTRCSFNLVGSALHKKHRLLS
jgi:hypothetical protein